MRIAFMPNGSTANTVYRSIAPMTALARRGHEVRRLDPQQPGEWTAAVQRCDLVHVHRLCDAGILQLARAAKAAGAAVVWDDDDDTLRPPKGIPQKKLTTGRQAAAQMVTRTKLFELADLVTTTNPTLAEVFRRDGARDVQVIENYVIDAFVRDRRPRSGICIGWAARLEHHLDLRHIPLVRVLESLLAAHSDLHVTTIGIALGELPGQRYRHIAGMPMEHFMSHLTSFDIGIAPLSGAVAINRARSNVKVKEYAAVGVPWLASPIGPYAGLGEREGGRLVPDDRWHDELDALIRNERTRRKLAKRAAKWGRTQLLSRNVERWERALEGALASAGAAA